MFFNTTMNTVNEAAGEFNAIANDIADIQSSLTSLGNKLETTKNGTFVLIRKAFVLFFFKFKLIKNIIFSETKIF